MAEDETIDDDIEFSDDEEEEDEELPVPTPKREKRVEPARKKIMAKKQGQKEKVKVQYVPVPRAVPNESMLNEIYDALNEIRELNQRILNKLENE